MPRRSSRMSTKPNLVSPHSREEITAINLRRILILLGLGFVLTLVIEVTSLLLTSPSHEVMLESGTLGVILLFIILNYRVENLPPSSPWRLIYTGAFLLLLFVYIDACALLLQDTAFTATYILGVILAGALLLLPPRIFFPLLILNHLIYGTLLFTMKHLSPQLFLQDTGGIIIASAVSWLLFSSHIKLTASEYRLRKNQARLHELVTGTAHDLRSPLLGVRDLLAIVQREETHSERTSRILTSTSDACARMLALVGRLEDAHNAEQQMDDGVELLPEDIRKPLSDAVERARANFAAKGNSIHATLPDTPVILPLHIPTVATVVDNLLSNAVKFSPPNSAIILALAKDDLGWHCDIIDESPGISNREQAHLFQRFHRGSAQATGGETTSGFGLFIVAISMKSLEGSVEYLPRPDKGACFRLRFADSVSHK
ncbi:MAG: HAMP domain-containing sensor histidine kinase [Chthoniobacterales bacterium]